MGALQFVIPRGDWSDCRLRPQESLLCDPRGVSEELSLEITREEKRDTSLNLSLVQLWYRFQLSLVFGSIKVWLGLICILAVQH